MLCAADLRPAAAQAPKTASARDIPALGAARHVAAPTSSHSSVRVASMTRAVAAQRLR